MTPHPLLPAAAQVKRLVCRECGKACRSETEWEVHSKRTGHAAFDDKARQGDAGHTLPWFERWGTAARQPPSGVPPPASARSLNGHRCLSPCPCAQTHDAQAVDTEAQMAAARAEEGIAAPSDASVGAAEERVPAEVNAELLKQMEEMVGGAVEEAERAVRWIARGRRQLLSPAAQLPCPPLTALPMPCARAAPATSAARRRASRRCAPRGHCTTLATPAWRRLWGGWRSMAMMPTSTNRCWWPRCGGAAPASSVLLCLESRARRVHRWRRATHSAASAPYLSAATLCAADRPKEEADA